MMLTAADISWQLPELPTEDRVGDRADMLVNVLVEAQSYRVLAQQAVHALHGLTDQHDRLRKQHHRLVDEYRRLNGQPIRPKAA